MKIDNNTIQALFKKQEANLNGKTDYLKFKAGFQAAMALIDESDQRQALVNYLNDGESILTEKSYKDVTSWGFRNGIKLTCETGILIEGYQGVPAAYKVMKVRIKEQ